MGDVRWGSLHVSFVSSLMHDGTQTTRVRSEVEPQHARAADRRPLVDERTHRARIRHRRVLRVLGGLPGV